MIAGTDLPMYGLGNIWYAAKKGLVSEICG